MNTTLAAAKHSASAVIDKASVRKMGCSSGT